MRDLTKTDMIITTTPTPKDAQEVNNLTSDDFLINNATQQPQPQPTLKLSKSKSFEKGSSNRRKSTLGNEVQIPLDYEPSPELANEIKDQFEQPTTPMSNSFSLASFGSKRASSRIDTSQQQSSTVTSMFELDLCVFLRNHALFGRLPGEFLETLSRKMHLRHFHAGDVIVREGETGKAMFLLIRGVVTVSSRDGDSIYADLHSGSFFGEIGALFDVPRTATCLAKYKCDLAVLTQADMSQLIQQYPEIGDEVRYEAQERYFYLLNRGRVKTMESGSNQVVPDFHKVPPETFAKIQSMLIDRDDVKEMRFKLGQVIYEHGSTITNGIFVIQEGVVELQAGSSGRQLVQLRAGMFFGECAVMRTLNRTETAVCASSNSTLIFIPNEVVEELLINAAHSQFDERLQRAAKRSENWSTFQSTRVVKTASANPSAPGSGTGTPTANSSSGANRRSLAEDAIVSSSPTVQLSSVQSSSNILMLLDLPSSPTSASITESNPQITPPSSYSMNPLDVPSTAKNRRSIIFGTGSNIHTVVSAAELSSSSTVKSSNHLMSSASASADAINRSLVRLHTESSEKGNRLGSSPDSGKRKSSRSIHLEDEEGTQRLSRSSSNMSEKEQRKKSNNSLGSVRELTGSAGSVRSSQHSGSENDEDDESDEFDDEADRNMLMKMTANRGINKIGNLLSSAAADDPSRRRASIAIWADSKLTEIANSKSISPASPSSPSSPSSTVNRFANNWAANSDLNDLNPSNETSLKDSETSIYKLNSKAIDEPLKDPRMLSLILSYLSFKVRWQLRGVNKHWAETITQSYTLTSVIDFTDSAKMVDDPLIELLSSRMPRLEVLILKNCWKITNTALNSLAKYSKSLQVLDTCGCWDLTDDGVTALSLGCRQLKSIDLSNCRKVTDRGILSLMSNCNGLRDLFVSYCKALTDAILAYSAKVAPGLRRVNFQRCLGLTDSGYSQFATNRHFKMQEMNLSDCSFLTDASVGYIASSCPNLKVLNLSFCCAMTDAIWDSLVANCPNLMVLDVSFCGAAVSDEALQKISSGFRNLERLSIRGCIRVTDVGVGYLLENGNNIKFINLSNCKNVTKEKLQQVATQKPDWKLLNAQTALMDSNIVGADRFGSTHIRRFTA